MDENVILFDLDGTLTDPKEGITKSVAYALKKQDILIENLDELCVFIGPPLIESFAKYFHLSTAQAQQAVEDYRVYFKKQGMLENKVYIGIEKLLSSLQKNGKTLLVATSKPCVFAKEILLHFDLAKYFTEIYGSELDGTRSQKTDVIAYALQKQSLISKDCIMIGDRKHDIIGAKANHIKSIGVVYGYGDYEELHIAGADAIVETIEELTQLLQQ